MKRLFFIISVLTLFTKCEDSNPSSSTPPLTSTLDLNGSWVTTKIHYYGNYNDGVNYDSTSITTLENPDVDMWYFTNSKAVRYEKEGDKCFHKTDSIPYVLSGNDLTGEYWAGTECDEPDCFKWTYAIKKSGDNLILTYTEIETTHGNITSTEVWEYYLNARSSSLDLLATSISGCSSIH
jgi:hypothetical protein